MNKTKKHYMGMALCISTVIGLFLSLAIYWHCDKRQVYKERKEYGYVLGAHGKYKANYIGYNDVFPNQIPNSAKVEKFHYEYLKTWSDNYLGYLVIHCNQKDLLHLVDIA